MSGESLEEGEGELGGVRSGRRRSRGWGGTGEGFEEGVILEEAVADMAEEGVGGQFVGVLDEGLEVGKEEGEDQCDVELVFDGCSAATEECGEVVLLF